MVALAAVLVIAVADAIQVAIVTALDRAEKHVIVHAKEIAKDQTHNVIFKTK